jgi:ribosome-binding factor A
MKRATSIRSTRLADLIMRELARMLEEDATDPRLEMVTISGLALNADLSVARVLYTLTGDAERLRQAAAALEQAKGFLRGHLGRRLRIKFVPELRFERDTFLEDMVYARPDA